LTSVQKNQIIILNKMNMKNTKPQRSNNQKSNQNQNQMKNNKINKNCGNPIPFYITVVSVTAIFALLVIFFIEKQENLKCINMGLIQKVDDGKIVWVKNPQ
jgi:ABC-type lipoprotein release transport system permease subunit